MEDGKQPNFHTTRRSCDPYVSTLCMRIMYPPCVPSAYFQPRSRPPYAASVGSGVPEGGGRGRREGVELRVRGSVREEGWGARGGLTTRAREGAGDWKGDGR